MLKLINTKNFPLALDDLFDRIKGEKRVQIVVPDKLSLFMEKFLFEKMNICSSFNIKVSTFNRFAKRNLDIPKEKEITRLGSILLINKILNENMDKLLAIKSKSYSFNYAETIFDTISQLKSSKITPDEMMRFKSKNVELQNKILDLALIYSSYEEQKAGYLDASDSFLMSIFSVCDGLDYDEIYFLGFDDFTAIEYSILERLIEKENIFIYNYKSNESNSYIYNKEMEEQLKNLCFTNNFDYKIENSELKSSGLNEFLSNNLFATKNNTFEIEKSNFEIVSCKNIADELDYVARRIILSEKPLNSFGVAVYDLEGNKTKVEEIFKKFEINHYIDCKIALYSSVFYKFLLSVLKYNSESYNLCHLIDIISSPFCEMGENDKIKLINELKSKKFLGLVNEDFEVRDDLKEIRDNFVSFMLDLNFSGLKVNEIIEKLVSKRENYESIISNLSNLPQEKLILNKSVDLIYSSFDEILKFTDSLNLEKFIDIFSNLGGICKINNLPLSVDAVKVVEANDNMEIFDNLFILNFTSENVPNVKNDCGVILDKEISELNFKNKLNPTIAHINRVNRLRLFNSMLLFNDSLTLTYSKHPSELVRALNEKIFYTENGIKKSVVKQNVEVIKNVALTKWDYIETTSKLGKFSTLGEKLIKDKDFSLKNKENLEKINALQKISASSLESYFKCPLYYFLNNDLKIKERENIEIESFDIGNIIHDLLYSYYNLKKEVGDKKEFVANHINNYIKNSEKLKLSSSSPIIKNLIDECIRLLDGVDYIDKNSLFVPSKFEFEFKNKTSLKLDDVNLEGKIDRVDIFNDMFRIVDYKTGNVDSSLKEFYYGTKLQLILYSLAIENILKLNGVGAFYLPLHNDFSKTEQNSYSLSGIYLNDESVAMSMDTRLLPSTKSDIVNIKLKKDGSVSKLDKALTIKELKNVENFVMEISKLAIDEIKSGYINPKPNKSTKICEYCPYKNVCLRDSNGLVVREFNSVDTESFTEGNDERI